MIGIASWQKTVAVVIMMKREGGRTGGSILVSN